MARSRVGEIIPSLSRCFLADCSFQVSVSISEPCFLAAMSIEACAAWAAIACRFELGTLTILLSELSDCSNCRFLLNSP